MRSDVKRAHADDRLRDEKIAWLTTVRNVQTNPKVAVHLRDIDDGADLRMDAASFARAYSVTIRIRPRRVRIE